MAFEDSALRHGCWDALGNLPEANSDSHLKDVGHGKNHGRPCKSVFLLELNMAQSGRFKLAVLGSSWCKATSQNTAWAKRFSEGEYCLYGGFDLGAFQQSVEDSFWKTNHASLDMSRQVGSQRIPLTLWSRIGLSTQFHSRPCFWLWLLSKRGPLSSQPYFSMPCPQFCPKAGWF